MASCLDMASMESCCSSADAHTFHHDAMGAFYGLWHCQWGTANPVACIMHWMRFEQSDCLPLKWSETFCGGILAVAQSKTIAELDAELTLPLVANSALAFLRRHLALDNGQIRPLDESMQANSKRLEAIEARIASQAISRVSTSYPILSVTLGIMISISIRCLETVF